MTWLDRLSPTIDLTSPGGNVFEALWQNNPRSLAKKLGIFEFPGVKGAIVQDLDVGSTRYPLTIFFEGQNNDLEGTRFFEACKERGVWTIIHPVKGTLTLQLISVSESISPVESGNITKFETDWIEPISEATLPSVSELRSTVLNQVNDVDESSSDQLEDVSQLETAEEITGFEAAVNGVVAAVVSNLKSLYELNSTINSQILSIIRGLNALISEPVLDVVSIAGQMQALVKLPALAVANVGARVSAYQDFVDAIINSSPDKSSSRNLNVIGIQEISMVSAIAAVSSISVTGSLESRSESVSLIDSVSQLFIDVTNSLDAVQDLYQDNPITLQYYSQSQSFADTALIVARTLAYLLRTTFDLSIEKSFILLKNRAPFEITLSEYGAPGEGDSNFDLFIESNALQGNDILLLPAGHEVVVYI